MNRTTHVKCFAAKDYLLKNNSGKKYFAIQRSINDRENYHRLTKGILRIFRYPVLSNAKVIYYSTRIPLITSHHDTLNSYTHLGSLNFNPQRDRDLWRVRDMIEVEWTLQWPWHISDLWWTTIWGKFVTGQLSCIRSFFYLIQKRCTKL